MTKPAALSYNPATGGFQASAGLVSFATLAEAAAASIPTTILSIYLDGYYAPGDDGGGQYMHASAGAGPGKFEGADGQWWVLTGATINLKQFGAKGDGSTDDSTAWQNALTFCNSQAFAGSGSRSALTVAKLAVSPGNYLITTGATLATANLSIQGADPATTCFTLGSGQNLINVNGASSNTIAQLYLRGISTEAGAGVIYHTPTGSNVTYFFVVEDCNFFDYTVCALGTTATDMPNWKVSNCIFQGTSALTSIGFANAGLTDDCVFIGNEWRRNRYHMKLAAGGNNVQILANGFLRYTAGGNSPILTDIWIVPAPTFQNAGPGCVMQGNKFGNEGISTGDYRILLADSDAGTGANFILQYHATTVSTGYCEGQRMINNLVNGNSGQTVGVIYSYTPNFRSWKIGDEYGGGTFPYIVHFDAGVTITDERTNESSTICIDGYLQPFEGTRPPYSNQPSIAVIEDNFGLNAGQSYHRNEFGAGFDAGYTLQSNTISMPINSMTTSSASVAPVTDLVGGTNAGTITFSASGGYIFGVTAALTPNRLAFLELDILVSGTQPLVSMDLELQNQISSALAFRRYITIPSIWQTIRFPWVPRTSNAYNFLIKPRNFSAGVATQVTVGRARVTQGTEPVHPGAVYREASVVLTPGTIAAGAAYQGSITVPGATIGDFPMVSSAPQFLPCPAFAFAADTVTFFIPNYTGGTITYGSTTFYARVYKRLA